MVVLRLLPLHQCKITCFLLLFCRLSQSLLPLVAFFCHKQFTRLLKKVFNNKFYSFSEIQELKNILRPNSFLPFLKCWHRSPLLTK